MIVNESLTSPIRVMIADDHPLFRQGFKLALTAYPDLELVAEAENREQAVRLAAERRPDIVVMNLQTDLKEGIAAILEITEVNREARILILTNFDDDDHIFQAIKAGVMGYLLKEISPEKLVESIRAVHRHEVALHPAVAHRLMQEIKLPANSHPESESLTPREMDVLKRLARGLSNHKIANELSVSVRTVTTHIGNILNKLHLENRTQAALYAIEQGIILQLDQPEEPTMSPSYSRR